MSFYLVMTPEAAQLTLVLVSIGGWIVDFMMHERGGSQTNSGYVATGFWAGVTVGRLALGLVNEWLGAFQSFTRLFWRLGKLTKRYK